ncbi:MAG: adenosylcobinamide amidohydrolase [Thermoleophilaceae bacterium]
MLERHELLDGVRYERRRGVVTLCMAAPWQVLSSAVLVGGRRHVRSLVHLQVPLSYRCERPERDLRAAVRSLGLDGPTVGLMTAVDLAETQLFAARAADVDVRAIVTVGLRNAARAGEHVRARPGTINIVLLCARRIGEAAAVELAMLAAEAKAAALVEAGVTTPSGRVASGTSTDAIAILWRRTSGREVRHAGSATQLGSAVGRIVTDAVRRGVERRAPAPGTSE